jgi:hypothetical protein
VADVEAGRDRQQWKLGPTPIEPGVVDVGGGGGRLPLKGDVTGGPSCCGPEEVPSEVAVTKSPGWMKPTSRHGYGFA